MPFHPHCSSRSWVLLWFSILKMKKLRFREVHQFPQTRSAGLWWSQDTNPGPRGPEAEHQPLLDALPHSLLSLCSLPPRLCISHHTSPGSWFQSPGLGVSYRQSEAAAKNLVRRTSWCWLVPLIPTFFGSSPFTLHWLLQGTEWMMVDQKDIKE